MSETKASDLVERLHNACHGDWSAELAFIPRVMTDAAIEIESLRAKLAAAEARLTMLDGTLTLERGFGIDTHATMLAVAKKATARQIELESRLKIAREALEAMLVDPPATLDEPDTDAGVIFKMREIAENALFLTSARRARRFNAIELLGKRS